MSTILFTRLLTVEDKKYLSDVATTACQFQPYIQKSYELRVTTIGTEHISTRIDVPDIEHTNDWREVTEKCNYLPWILPEETGVNLSALLSSLGLQYAASDFIVIPEGDLVFLEANPHGAWLWLEQRLPSLAIASSFATYLTNLANA